MSMMRKINGLTDPEWLQLFIPGWTVAGVLKSLGAQPTNVCFRNVVIANSDRLNVGRDGTHKAITRRYSIKDVTTAAVTATSWSDMCRALSVSICTFNFKKLQQLCIDNEIDVSHFGDDTTRGYNKGIGLNRSVWTPETALVGDSTVSRSQLRPLLIKFGMYTGVCAHCNTPDNWNGKPLTIEIDHIDGDHTNNEITNLRWLCPNCHSQTDTYRRSNKLRTE